MEMHEIKKDLLNILSKNDDGLTIFNIMEKLPYHRMTIKINLLELAIDNKVRIIRYTKNNVVYKIIN